MAEYGEWNRKGATLSDVTASKAYGVDRDFIVKGIRAGTLEYREGSIWGNPYLRLLRSQLQRYITEQLGADRLSSGKHLTELRKIKKEMPNLKKRLKELESRRTQLENQMGRQEIAASGDTALTDTDIGLTEALGLQGGVVRLVPYNPAWPVLFEREANALRTAVGNGIGRIEHMGATSIPGTEAKPVLDLMAEVNSEAEGVALSPAIQTLGYEFRPDEDVPGRLYFWKGSPDRRCTHHLSLTEKGSEFWNTQLSFRDQLRSDAELRQNYIALKQDLALQFPHDRLSYTEGKTKFVKMVLELADLK